jgi:GAF domain-containing protein
VVSAGGSSHGDDGVDRRGSTMSPQLLLDRTCSAVADSARADGVAVALMSVSGARELVYASTAVAQYLDDIQFTSGVGPCLDAFSSEQPVLCPNLRAPEFRERWLDFVDDASVAGAASVFAFPLVSGSTVFGSLELPHFDGRARCCRTRGDTHRSGDDRTCLVDVLRRGSRSEIR